MDIVITPTLAYIIGSVAVGTGITIATNDDLYDLCYLYYDYMSSNAEEAWEGLDIIEEERDWNHLNDHWNNNTQKTPDGKQFVIPPVLLEHLKKFFDNVFGDKIMDISKTVWGDFNIPTTFTCKYKIEEGMEDIIINFTKFYFEVKFYRDTGNNSIISVGFYDRTTMEYIINDDGVGMQASLFSGANGLDSFTHFIGWDIYQTSKKLIVSFINNGLLAQLEVPLGIPGMEVNFPYDGGYNWEENIPDTEEPLEVPIISPDIWVGTDTDPDEIWNPKPEHIPDSGDTITLPTPNDDPIINVGGDDIVIENPNDDPNADPDTPDDIPEDVPEDPTIPNIPIIPPVDVPDVPTEIPEGDDGELDEDITDNWGNANSGGLYYYYIGTDVADSGIDDVIGHATGVVSLSYTPYLYYNDCNITKIPYDSERFGQPSTFSNFYVYRINNVTRPVKKVGGFTAYDDSFSVDIGEGRPYSYKNETKLYQYPYSFAYVYDGINQPMEVKYHYLSYVYNDIYIKQTVSDKCTYGIFIKDYKGDAEGNLESVVLTSGNELPCSSSTYAQWFATNRNQINQNVQNVLATNAIQSHGSKQQFEIQKDMSTMNVIGGLGTALAGLFTMNIGGVGTGLMNAFNTTNMLKSQQATLNTQLALNKQSDQNAIQSAMALNNDMRNAPPTIISHGSNVFYGILNTDRKLLLIRMGLSEVDLYRIGTYFTMYGYKQNKLMDINLRSRKYFNYFKITAPNIVSYSVPHSQLESIKEIFKNGITLWHYNNSDKVLDYFHSDNYEV